MVSVFSVKNPLRDSTTFTDCVVQLPMFPVTVGDVVTMSGVVIPSPSRIARMSLHVDEWNASAENVTREYAIPFLHRT